MLYRITTYQTCTCTATVCQCFSQAGTFATTVVISETAQKIEALTGVAPSDSLILRLV